MCDVLQWTVHTVDRLLTEGDATYLRAFQEQTIPDTGTISLTYLPGRTFCSQTEYNPEVKLNLNVIEEEVVNEIFSINSLSDDTSEDQLMESLLELDFLNIMFDAQSKQIIDIGSVNI